MNDRPLFNLMKYIAQLISLFVFASCSINKYSSNAAYELLPIIAENTPEKSISIFIDQKEKIGAIYYIKEYPFPHIFEVTITDKVDTVYKKEEIFVDDFTSPYVFFNLKDLESGTYIATIRYPHSIDGRRELKEFKKEIYF